MSSSKVRVAVRLKPEARTLRRCALAEGSNEVIVGAKRFTYDHVYNEETSQIDIYNECVHDLVEGCFKGYNGTLFAYGQTGSGKTFSTIGLPHDTEDEGIIPRALRHIFTYLDASSNEDEGGNKTIKLASVHVSFLEIYNEECKDLLHPEIQSREIMIREDKGMPYYSVSPYCLI
jgi:kinesin family member 3A